MMTNTRSLMAVLLLFGLSAAGAATVPTSEKMINEGDYRGTPWINGGVGEEERKYLLEKYADDFNLKLELAVAQGSYLADVWARITKPTGEVVVNSLTDGPWFMTKLPAGNYKVRVMGFGKTCEKTVQVPATGLRTVVFNQWTKEEVAEHTPGPTF
jgi:hypothetical protein